MATRRIPLSRDRVLEAAIALADEAGIESLTMRKLAQDLGVEAMSLYYHVANKEDLLDGMVDLVVGEIELPADTSDWKASIRQTAISAHEVFLRHRWACSLMLSSIRVDAQRLRYMESLLSTLREGGFSPELAHHAYHAIDSHIAGFVLWQTSFPIPTGKLEDIATGFLQELPAGEYPYVVEHVHQHLVERDPDEESFFEFGLNLILDGLERLRQP